MKLPVELHVYMASMFAKLDMREALVALASTCRIMKSVYLRALHDECRFIVTEEACRKALEGLPASHVAGPRWIAFVGTHTALVNINQFITRIASGITKLELMDAIFPVANVLLVLEMVERMDKLKWFKYSQTQYSQTQRGSDDDTSSMTVLMTGISELLPRFAQLEVVDISPLPHELSTAVFLLPSAIRIYINGDEIARST